MGEQVLVVRRSELFGGQWPQGFVARTGAGAAALLADLQRRGFFVARDRAEEDPTLKQLIPYCMLCRPGEVFCVERLRRQSEGRLHGMLSIGIGGHVNPLDGPHADVLNSALYRELHEEMVLPRKVPERPRFLGLINDDSTPVGSVHLGLAHALVLPAGSEVRIRETEKMRGSFWQVEKLEALAGGEPPKGSVRVVESATLWQHPPFESWSTIMLEARPWARLGACEGSRRGGVRREESHDG